MKYLFIILLYKVLILDQFYVANASSLFEFSSPGSCRALIQNAHNIDSLNSSFYLCSNVKSSQNFVNSSHDEGFIHYHSTHLNLDIHTPLGVKIHFNTYFNLTNFSSKDTDPIYDLDKELLLELGTPGLNYIYGSAGKQKASFGIHFSNLEPSIWILDEIIGKQSKFWETPNYSLKLTFDDKNTIVYDISLAADQLKKIQHHLFSKEESAVISMRLMKDFSFSTGTRFFLSGLANKKGERRWGFGMLGSAKDGSKNSIEMVRIRTQPDGKKSPYKQIIQLSFFTPFKRNKRDYISISAVRFSYNSFSYGYEYSTSDHSSINLSLTYKNNYIDSKDSFWLLAGGITYKR